MPYLNRPCSRYESWWISRCDSNARVDGYSVHFKRSLPQIPGMLTRKSAIPPEAGSWCRSGSNSSSRPTICPSGSIWQIRWNRVLPKPVNVVNISQPGISGYSAQQPPQFLFPINEPLGAPVLAPKIEAFSCSEMLYSNQHPETLDWELKPWNRCASCESRCS